MQRVYPNEAQITRCMTARGVGRQWNVRIASERQGNAQCPRIDWLRKAAQAWRHKLRFVDWYLQSGPSSCRGFKVTSKSKVFVALAFLVAPSTVAAEDTNVRVEYSSAQYLKNFALSVCISDAYKSEEVVKDSLHAAGGYFELGSFPIEAYEETRALGNRFLAKEYRGIHGEKLILMKCIDFFHSKELKQLVRKYGKK
jgi:hypothetical protein